MAKVTVLSVVGLLSGSLEAILQQEGSREARARLAVRAELFRTIVKPVAGAEYGRGSDQIAEADPRAEIMVVGLYAEVAIGVVVEGNDAFGELRLGRGGKGSGVVPAHSA